MPPLLFATGVAFELPNGRELFENLTFSLGAGCTGLVGPNGVGKTTLARILSGEIEPSRGVVRHGEAPTLLAQRVPPSASSVEAFLAEHYQPNGWGEAFLEGIDRASKCDALSGGEWMRVRLASVLAERFLILDEPTNDLDRRFRGVLFDFLRSHRAGALLISHDRDLLRRCDAILELSNRGVAKFGGGWDDYEASKARARESSVRDLERAKRDRELAAVKRTELRERQEKRNRRGRDAAARGGIPKILLGKRKRQAQATTGRIDAQSADEVDRAVREAHEAYRRLKTDPVMYADLLGAPLHASALVADARDFNVRFDEWLYPRDLRFAWHGNVRIAVTGANGSGKSTLLRALAGERLETRGDLDLGKRRALYVDQRCAMLEDERSVLENVRSVARGSESEIRNGLAKFLFVADQVFLPVGRLSGGERLRAALARAFLSTERPELLLLDEPTNNLDLANVDFLEGFLRAFPGAVVVVSHDEDFLRNARIGEAFAVGD